jgi:hypothetical protein
MPEDLQQDKASGGGDVALDRVLEDDIFYGSRQSRIAHHHIIYLIYKSVFLTSSVNDN